MTIYCTGGRGRVGKELVELGIKPLEFNILDRDQIRIALLTLQEGDVVCHLAGISDVDYCEKIEYRDVVIATNVRSVFNIAAEAEARKCGMVVISTDHIFSGGNFLGLGRGPYKENAKPNPQNFYAQTKLSAESFVGWFRDYKIVRTSRLFSKNGLEKDILHHNDYPTFIHRSFVSIENFSASLKAYLDRFWEMPSILHVSGDKTISWYDFMKYCCEKEGWKEPTPRTKESNTFYAKRPKYGGLDCSLAKSLAIPIFDYTK